MFHRPNVRTVVERFILYRLRFDGIACNQHGKTSTYYQLSLEVANCNEHTRRKVNLSCLGMLVPNDSKKLEYIRDYLRRVMILGINGVWIKQKGQWNHWRWYIVSVGCDTVAQEQLIGEPNKKRTGSPFLFGKNKRVRFNPSSMAYQDFYDKLPVEYTGKMAIPSLSMDLLNPNSLLRCPSLIHHSDNPDSLIANIEKDYQVTLDNSQKKEIKYTKLFLDIFGDNAHQFLPNVLKEEDIPKFKEKCMKEANPSMSLSQMNPFLQTGKGNNKQHESFLDGNLVVPTEHCLCLDGMHNLSNICQIFINIVSGKDYCSEMKVINKEICNILKYDPSQWNICPTFKEVYKCAASRQRELMRRKLVTKDLLNSANFTKATTYERIMYLFSFYSYLFQDSMKIPFIFFFKIIFDYLAYFVSVNYDIQNLVEKQRNFNIVLGFLQNEVLPYYLKISIYNAMYYAYCIFNCGDMPANCCWLQESFYELTRDNFYGCRNPEDNTSYRLMMLSMIFQDKLFESKVAHKSVVYRVRRETITIPLLERRIVVSGESITNCFICNFYDELMYYVDSSYNRNTFLDKIIKKNIGINSPSFDKEAEEYSNSLKIDFSIFKLSDIFFSVEKTDINPFIKIGNSILAKDNSLNSKQIAFMQSSNGGLDIFYIVGFLSALIKYEEKKFHFTNCVCLRIPSESGSSLVNTTTNGFLKIDEFWELLSSKNPPLFLVSINRLHIDFLQYYPFKNKCAFASNRMFVRQNRPHPRIEIFEELKKQYKID